MKKLLLVIILAMVTLFSTSCKKSSAVPTQEIRASDKTIKSSSIGDFILDGTWEMGGSKETGPEATMIINNTNQQQFVFSIDALYVSTITSEDGQTYLNPHEGGIQGVAYFKAPTEAIYSIDDDDYPNYQMVFSIKKSIIDIQEIDTTTGEDYGYSPYAGLNVRYFGTYIRKK